MCKAKSAGGRRCQYHLTVAVTAGLTSHLSAVSGLPASEARTLVDDLKRDGQGASAPTREEVDGFLAAQDFRIRHEEALPDDKRKSILNRLREAFGRVLPDGATFHAWRTMLAEAWSRHRRAAAAGLTAGVLALGLSACSTSNSSDHSAVPRPPAASATSSPQVSVAPLAASGGAVNTFGQDKVQAGYMEMADYASRYAYQRDLLAKSAVSASDFAGPREQMTPTMQARWDANVTKAIAGDKTGHDSLMCASYYGLNDNEMQVATSGPVVVNQRISNPTVSIGNGGQRMILAFTQSGDIRITRNGAPARLPMTKQVTYYLVPAPAGSSHQWLIEGLKAHYTSGNPISDTAS